MTGGGGEPQRLEPDDEAPARERLASGWRALQSWIGGRGARLAIWVGVGLVAVGTVGFFVVLDALRDADDLAGLDEPVLSALVDGRSEVLTWFLVVVTTVSGTTVLPIIVLVSALAWGLWRKRWWQAGLLAGAMVTSTIVSVSLKRIVARPRPPVDTMLGAGLEESYSFPSGHTIGAATLLLVAGYLVWVTRPTVRSLLMWLAISLVGVVLVAVSRLYLGYHFVTDVVASMALAVAVLGGVVVVDRRRAGRAARAAADSPDVPTDPGRLD